MESTPQNCPEFEIWIWKWIQKFLNFFYILVFSTKSLILFFSSVQITPQPLHNCPEFDIWIWKWILKCLNFKIVVFNWKSFFFFFFKFSLPPLHNF